MNYSSSLSPRNFTNSRTYKSQVFDNMLSFRENNESNEHIKNYFSINDYFSKNDNERKKIPNYPNTRGKANTIKEKIKKISGIKFIQYKGNLINKKKHMNSNPNILENRKDKKKINKNNIYQALNNINRSNSNYYANKLSYKCILNKNKYELLNSESFNPTIIRKKTDILIPKLKQIKNEF